jgi:mitochondrial chaperone BCS1
MLSRDVQYMRLLLQEAREFYMLKQEASISVYKATIYSWGDISWKQVCRQPKRAMSSIVLEPGIKNLLLEDAREFLRSKDWYAARGIPFRRGYLLYGAPGSGKTSIIHCLAGELGLDVYIISLSKAQMDDNTLGDLIGELPDRCIALMEDIDAAFMHGLNREDEEDGESGKEKTSLDEGRSKVTLSGLLNALDGIGAQEGRILFATTNKYSALDPALCRPGRMDIHIEFKNASKYQAQELFKNFYLPNAQDARTEEDYQFSAELQTPQNDKNDPQTSTDSNEKTAESLPEVASFSEWIVNKRQGGPPTAEEISQLAPEFASEIPDREFSMASLQGYLMGYKTRPQEAVKHVREWMEKARAEEREKERVKEERREKREAAKKKKDEEAAKKIADLLPGASSSGTTTHPTEEFTTVKSCEKCGSPEAKSDTTPLPQ